MKTISFERSVARKVAWGLRASFVFLGGLSLLIFTVSGTAVSAPPPSSPPITVLSELGETTGQTKAWPMPESQAIQAEWEHWLRIAEQSKAKPTDPEEFRMEEIPASWSILDAKPSGVDLFQAILESLRQSSPAIEHYLKTCDAFAWQEIPFGREPVLPQIPLQLYLGESKSTKFLVGALKLYLAQRLVQGRLYDEASPILDELTSENSVDPLSVLMIRAVVQNHLGEIDKGLSSVEAFRQTAELVLEAGQSVPRRYTELAKLLEFDLKAQKESQADSRRISRKMDDVRRRLGKGRTDDETQQAEEDVMKSLDKLIEKVQRQCQKAQNAGDGEGRQANNPADDSRLLTQKGPGHVDRRDFEPGDSWGDLPPKEREEALLKIEREFPAHYRDIIEQYFREMADLPSKH